MFDTVQKTKATYVTWVMIIHRGEDGVVRHLPRELFHERRRIKWFERRNDELPHLVTGKELAQHMLEQLDVHDGYQLVKFDTLTIRGLAEMPTQCAVFELQPAGDDTELLEFGANMAKLNPRLRPLPEYFKRLLQAVPLHHEDQL